MITDTIRNTIEKHRLLEKHQHIIIGLSGGPDSVCLFHVLYRFAEEMDLKLYPVHINHQLRGGDAAKDQRYAENLCLRYGLVCRSFSFDCNEIARTDKRSSEEVGRMARYKAFAEVAKELVEQGVKRDRIRIAVAHNAEDQVETILFRFLRGTGIDGLCGIAYRRRDQYGNLIVRPLMDVYKKDILAYCHDQGLHPCIDQTNLLPIYTRNKLRLQLIPMLEEEYNSRFKDTMIRMGEDSAQDSDYLWQQADLAFEKAVKAKGKTEILLDGEYLLDLHEAITRRVLSKAFAELGLEQNLTHIHYRNCLKLLKNHSPSVRTDLPQGYYLCKVYDDIKAAKIAENVSPQVNIQVVDAEDYDNLKLTEGKFAAFDYEALKAVHGYNAVKNLHLGKRREGDFLPIKSGQGEDKPYRRKKLQDFFVDQKIPKDQRDKVVLLKIGSEILWILPWQNGMRKGRFTSQYKLCPDTKKVIYIEIIS